MKRIIAYSTAIILLLVSGCNKPLGTTVPEQFDRYIFFSQGVDTKAGLIENTGDLDGKEFAVLGYKYDINSTWDAFKATNKGPNVFVTGDNKYETVECDASGDGSYEPLQGWSNSKKYTFFAYYPIDETDEPKVELVNANGGPYTGGSPYLKYSLDVADLKSSMVDLMTGDCNHLSTTGGKTHTAPCQKDLYWKSSTDNNIANGEVTFRFEHRLSSLGVKAKNGTTGSIKITGAAMQINGIQNETITIPLEGGTPQTTGPEAAYNAEISLDVPSGGESISNTTNHQELSDKLIFIPQTGPLSIRMIIEYERSANGYQSFTTTATIPADQNGQAQFLTVASLAEGTKYMIPLNFTESSVTVSGNINGEKWANSHEITDTFN